MVLAMTLRLDPDLDNDLGDVAELLRVLVSRLGTL